MSRPDFTENQPLHGDTVLHCGHLGTDNHHFWLAPGDLGLGFRRPNGTTGTAKWITACGACFKACGGDPQKLTIRGDGTWKGDKPAIVRDEHSGPDA